MNNGQPFNLLTSLPRGTTLPVTVSKAKKAVWAGKNLARTKGLSGLGWFANDGLFLATAGVGGWTMEDPVYPLDGGNPSHCVYVYRDFSQNPWNGEDKETNPMPIAGPVPSEDHWLKEKVWTKVNCERLLFAQNCVLRKEDERFVVDFSGAKLEWLAPRKGKTGRPTAQEELARPYSGWGDIYGFWGDAVEDWRFGRYRKDTAKDYGKSGLYRQYYADQLAATPPPAWFPGASRYVLTLPDEATTIPSKRSRMETLAPGEWGVLGQWDGPGNPIARVEEGAGGLVLLLEYEVGWNEGEEAGEGEGEWAYTETRWLPLVPRWTDGTRFALDIDYRLREWIPTGGEYTVYLVPAEDFALLYRAVFDSPYTKAKKAYKGAWESFHDYGRAVDEWRSGGGVGPMPSFDDYAPPGSHYQSASEWSADLPPRPYDHPEAYAESCGSFTEDAPEAEEYVKSHAPDAMLYWGKGGTEATGVVEALSQGVLYGGDETTDRKRQERTVEEALGLDDVILPAGGVDGLVGIPFDLLVHCESFSFQKNQRQVFEWDRGEYKKLEDCRIHSREADWNVRFRCRARWLKNLPVPAPESAGNTGVSEGGEET